MILTDVHFYNDMNNQERENKMHTKEEVKLNLLKFFSDRENKAVINFLNSYYKGKTLGYINIETPEKLFKDNRLHRFELKPFLIEDYEMVMELSIVKNLDDTFSHQISFQSDKKVDKDYSCELYPRVYVEKRLETELRIINGKIVIQRYVYDYRINPDYSIEFEPKRIVLGMEIDIVNRQFRIIGDNANQGVDHAYFVQAFMNKYISGLERQPLYSNEFKDEIKEEFKRNPDFKKAFKKYNLQAILGLRVDQILIAMRFLVEMPNSETLFINEKLTDAVLYEVTRINSISESQNTSPNLVLKNGESITEMLGFKKDYPRLVPILEVMGYGNIVDLRDQIEQLSAVMSFDQDDSILKYYELIKQKYLCFNSRWLYLGKRGYTIDELYQYFEVVERKQAIYKHDAIDYLYTVCNLYELKTGQFKKLYPKSLKLMIDVIKRDIDENKEKNQEQFFDNLLKKRKELFIETDEYKIVPSSEDTFLNKAVRVNDALVHIERVLYKSKSSSKYIEIRIVGESIRSISERVSDKHLENIKAWAKSNNLHIHSLDVKSRE